MSRSTARMIGGQFTAAIVAVIATALVMGGGFAFAQEAPASGNGVAEALAARNTVNGAAIINGSVGRADMKPGALPSWAKVGANASTATLLSGKGATSAAFFTAGIYTVTFSRSVVGCGWSATLNDNDTGASGAGEISIDRSTSEDPFTLRIKTYNSAGASAAPASGDGFTVVVTC